MAEMAFFAIFAVSNHNPIKLELSIFLSFYPTATRDSLLI